MCDQILDGTFDYDTLPNEETKQFVRNLKREPIPPISPDYPISDFIDGLKRWPENTSTSPSGRDLSQYKTILMEFPSDPSVSKKTDRAPALFTASRNRKRPTVRPMVSNFRMHARESPRESTVSQIADHMPLRSRLESAHKVLLGKETSSSLRNVPMPRRRARRFQTWSFGHRRRYT